MSLGDKAIIMLNLCHALKAVPCETMLTFSHIYVIHIDTIAFTIYLCSDQLEVFLSFGFLMGPSLF